MNISDPLPVEALSFLDAVAEGESHEAAREEHISPYFILVGGGSFEGMPAREGYFGFPAWPGREFSAGISHAAGRYQFEPATWHGMALELGLTDFRDAAQQDMAAWMLACDVYHRQTGVELLARLRAGLLGDIAAVLQSTWTSLSGSTFHTRYHEALACRAGAQDAPQATGVAAILPAAQQSAPATSVAPPGGIDPDSDAEAEQLNAEELQSLGDA